MDKLEHIEKLSGIKKGIKKTLKKLANARKLYNFAVTSEKIPSYLDLTFLFRKLFSKYHYDAFSRFTGDTIDEELFDLLENYYQGKLDLVDRELEEIVR